MLIQHRDAYDIDDAVDRIDLLRVHAWLASTYWSQTFRATSSSARSAAPRS